MVVQTLAAAGSAAESAGYVIGTLFIPGLGLLLLILGLVRRSSSKSKPSGQPGYPPSYPQPGYPQSYSQGYQQPGYPPTYPQQGYQPGYPQQPGYPPVPAQPYGAPPKKSGTAMIVIGAILLVLGLLGLAGKMATRASESSSRSESNSSSSSSSVPRTTSGSGSSRSGASDDLAVGECITSDQYATEGMDLTPSGCSTPDAIYELVSKGGGSATCPDGKRADSDYSVLMDGSRTYCFILNFEEGECFNLDDKLASLVECADPNAVIKIVQRVDGSTDPAVCGSGSRAVAFPEPARVYCAGKPS
ncbi:LppU/SCO3897 family protein [Mycobacterium sp. NPDC051198]